MTKERLLEKIATYTKAVTETLEQMADCKSAMFMETLEYQLQWNKDKVEEYTKDYIEVIKGGVE